MCRSSSNTRGCGGTCEGVPVSPECNGRCSCKAHNLACTELRKCEGAEDTCNNVSIDQNSSDDKENIYHTYIVIYDKQIF